jgi:hypothetical protein
MECVPQDALRARQYIAVYQRFHPYGFVPRRFVAAMAYSFDRIFLTKSANGGRQSAVGNPETRFLQETGFLSPTHPPADAGRSPNDANRPVMLTYRTIPNR